MMEFIVLGQVPGTQFQISFELVVTVILGLAIFLLSAYEIKRLVRRRRFTSTSNKDVPSLQPQA